MRIIDRYIFKSILEISLGCLLVFFGLYIIIDIFSHLDDILKHHVNLYLLMQYYISYLPIIFVQVAPIACLLSTLYTYGKLNRDNEIIAMRSSGLSVIQITKNIILFGIIISASVFLVSDRFVPQSLSLTQKFKTQMEAGAKKSHPKELEAITNFSMYGLKNRLFFVNKFYPATGTMEGIIILEHDETQNITKKIVAGKGVYGQDGFWRFYQSITYNFDKSGQLLNEPIFMAEEIMPIPETPAEFLNQRQRPDFMNIAQLDDYIWKLSRSGAITVIRNLKVDLYQRFTSPLTSIIIILLGIPFALKMKKRATGLSSVGLSIMVGFLYYLLNAISIALGKAGLIMPIMSALLPHALAFATAMYMIDKLP